MMEKKAHKSYPCEKKKKQENRKNLVDRITSNRKAHESRSVSSRLVSSLPAPGFRSKVEVEVEVGEVD